MDIGWGHPKSGNRSWPALANMDPEALEGLTDQGNLAKSSLTLEPSAPASPAELTDWQAEAVRQSQGRVVSDQLQEPSPYLLLDLPEIIRLGFTVSKNQWTLLLLRGS